MTQQITMALRKNYSLLQVIHSREFQIKVAWDEHIVHLVLKMKIVKLPEEGNIETQGSCQR